MTPAKAMPPAPTWSQPEIPHGTSGTNSTVVCPNLIQLQCSADSPSGIQGPFRNRNVTVSTSELRLCESTCLDRLLGVQTTRSGHGARVLSSAYLHLERSLIRHWQNMTPMWPFKSEKAHHRL